MRRSLRLFFAAGLILCAMPALAEEDDLLRPMIVRPTDAQPTSVPEEFAPDRPVTEPVRAYDSPAEAAVISQMNAGTPPPVAPNVSIAPNTPPTRETAKLKVPSLSKASALASVPTGPAPTSGAVFSDFGPATGSTVSGKVFKLRDETLALRQKLDQNINSFNDLRGKGTSGTIQYHATVAAITARLETGTTRSNPVLKRQWDEAQESLNEVSFSLSRLNKLNDELSTTAASAADLSKKIKETRELPGAVDEDHEQLGYIRDEVAKVSIQLDNMRGDVAKDIQRQSSYLANEKRNLQRLAKAIERGEMIRDTADAYVPEEPAPAPASRKSKKKKSAVTASALPSSHQAEDLPAPMTDEALQQVTQDQPSVGRDPAPTLPPQPPLQAPTAAAQGSSPGQLLVLVRFNQEVVNYEQPLYQAISDALDRKPDAMFTVVAVAPKSNDAAAQQGDAQSANRHAEDVKKSLTQLGLQASRISTSSASSEAAMVPEVHIYVR